MHAGFDIFVEINVTVTGSLFCIFTQCCKSVCLFLSWHSADCISMALVCVLKFGIIIPPVLLGLFIIALEFLCVFCVSIQILELFLLLQTVVWNSVKD